MGRKFKIGDHVCVHNSSYEYDGNYIGAVGVVKRDIFNGKYGVELDKHWNNYSPTGYFWFDAQSLIPQKAIDKKDVLVGDMKNGYSYVTAKEAAEIRVIEEINRNIRESINEFEKFRNDIPPVVLKPNYSGRIPHIENVIFNNPATIVFWSDGSKTIVKCKDEAFDEEKGLAMAISKKVLGNKGNYYNEFKKWLPEIEVWGINGGISMVEACRKAHDAVESFNKAMKGE